MGKNKLRKFAEMEQLDCVLQYPFARLKADGGFPMRGRWHSDVFGNDNPIVLELGCGKGEYAVGLAERFPGKNFIGIDIKGARMYTGARQTAERGLTNVRFLRTSIDLLHYFFSAEEVAEIWITFPDPQMKKQRKRLTSSNFLDLYRRISVKGGQVHLKTDSPFLYTYTRRLVSENALEVITDTADLYALPGGAGDILSIRTYYESQWLSRGKTIKYLNFRLPDGVDIREVDDTDIPRDDYRAYPRHTVVGSERRDEPESPLSL